MPHCLSVIGYYAGQNEITFAGIKEDIIHLANEADYNGPSKAIPFYVPDDSPAPYDGFLRGIRFHSAPGLLRFAVVSDFLVITGSPQFRQRFAATLLQATEETKFEGNDIERIVEIQYYPQHPFLAAASLAVTVNIIGCGKENARILSARDEKFDWAEMERFVLFDLPVVDATSLSARTGGHYSHVQ